VVGPGEVRLALKRFALKYGAAIVEAPAAYTTRDCATCGHRRDDVEDWAPLEIGCSSCGVVEDQDRTAARNLVARASDPVRGADGEALAPSTKAPRLRSRHTRKRKAEGGARQEAGNVV
jgi:transposase